MDSVALPLCAPGDSIERALEALTSAHRIAIVVDGGRPSVIFAAALRRAQRSGKTLLSQVDERESIDASAVEAPGETLQLTAFAPLVELDPTMPVNETVAAISSLTFDPLVRLDESGNVVPVLAAEVPTEANGGITDDAITFHLRPFVKWHDGTVLTSDDVVSSWENYVQRRGRETDFNAAGVVSSVETFDPETVSFRFAKSSSPAAKRGIGSSLIGMYVRKAHQRTQELVGTGAFNVIGFEPGHIDLVANSDYVLGKPNLDAIEIDTLTPRNVRTLSSGDVDTILEAAPNLYSAFARPPRTRSRDAGESLFALDVPAGVGSLARHTVARLFGRSAQSASPRRTSVWVVPSTPAQARAFGTRRELICDGPLQHPYLPPPGVPETRCDFCTDIGDTGVIHWV